MDSIYSYLLVVFVLIYLLILMYTLGNILYRVKNPAKTLSWLLVVIFLPIAGILLYRLIGRSVKKDKFFQQKKPFYQSLDNDIDLSRLPPNKHRLIELLNKNNSAVLSFDNQVQVLTDCRDAFDVLFSDMRSAKSTIHLDYYIIESGKMLDELTIIFEDRINVGINVRLIYDGFGTSSLDTKYISKLESIGVECQEFMPYNWIKWFDFVNYRNHRKIVIIDNEIAFTGGMNISDKYLDSDFKLGLWRDTFIRIKGKAASDFERVFQSDWFYAQGKSYDLEAFKNVKCGDVGVQVISSGPDSDYKGIMHEYFTIITDAEEYVYISTPYFVPGEAIMTALKTSALSGIDVRLMLPYDSDSKWLKWCMFTYLEELLAAGVIVYLYHDGFLHSKVMISDDIVSSVGTANVDERSFEANFEVNALVYDKITTIQLKDHFMKEIGSCEKLSLSKFSSRADRNKLMESLARLTSPIL